jgi:hypothetical protein
MSTNLSKIFLRLPRGCFEKLLSDGECGDVGLLNEDSVITSSRSAELAASS